MTDPREETNYDPALPGRIRREQEAQEEDEPGKGAPASPRRLSLPGLLMAAGVVVLGLLLLKRSAATPAAGALAQARLHLSERAWGKVSGDLAPLRAAGPLAAEAARLDDAARGMLRLEEAEKAGEWVTAYDAALDLRMLWKEEGALSLDIARRLDRARAEVLAAQKLAEARHQMASGDPQDALKALSEVPQGTASAEAAKAEAERALAARRERALAEAVRAVGERRWEEALRALDAAQAPADPRAQDLARLIAEGGAQQQALDRARALLAVLRVAEARSSLERVDPRGPCAAERAELASVLEKAGAEAERVDRARALFDKGRGEEALDALPAAGEGTGTVPAELRKGIAAAVKARQAVLDSLDRRDDLAALEAVRTLCAMPLSEGNGYRTEAERARQALELKVRGLAEQWVAEGVEAFRQQRYEASRAAFARVERAVPDHPVASFYRAQFAREGLELYRKGYVLRAMDPAAARESFRLALVCLPPDDPAAEKARKALGE